MTLLSEFLQHVDSRQLSRTMYALKAYSTKHTPGYPIDRTIQESVERLPNTPSLIFTAVSVVGERVLQMEDAERTGD